MYKRQIVVVLSDTHADYKFGLLPPGIELQALDESSETSPNKIWIPSLTSTQEKLWEWYLEDKKEILKLAGKDDMYLLHIGDVTQGNVLPKQLLVSGVMKHQYKIAEEVIMEYAKLKNLKGGRLIKGTGVHGGGSGTAEMVVAESLSDKTGKDFKSWHHMIFDLYGVRFDIAHHGVNNSAREWLEGNTLRYYMRDLTSRHLKNGDKPSDIILRGHYHDRKIEVWIEHLKDKTVWVWGAICPAYALFMDDYTLKATKSKPYMTAGTLAVEIIDGKIKDIHDLVHTVDIRRKESYG